MPVKEYWPWLALGGAAALLFTARKATAATDSQEAREALARVVIAEAGDIQGPCPEWAAIMQVVLNRVRSRRYPSNVMDVVTDSSWNSSQRYQELLANAHTSSRWDQALEQADRVLNGIERDRVGPRLHECHRGAACSPEGTPIFNDRGQHKWTCYNGHVRALWSLPQAHPDSTAEYEPIYVGRIVVS